MWQTLETKPRVIQQVMRGRTSVRSAEDFESGAPTFAEIKAIANPVGTVQSVEHTLRNIDKLVAHQQVRLDRLQKEPEDQKEQSNRPSEHQGKLRELLRHAELTKMLDLDKGDQQAVRAEPAIADGPDRPESTRHRIIERARCSKKSIHNSRSPPQRTASSGSTERSI